MAVAFQQSLIVRRSKLPPTSDLLSNLQPSPPAPHSGRDRGRAEDVAAHGEVPNIIADMNRVEVIKDIVEEFEEVQNELTNKELAVVSSVMKLESQHLTQIVQGVQMLFELKNVRIKTFTIRNGSSGSKLIGMCVRELLDEIANQLIFSDTVGSLAS